MKHAAPHFPHQNQISVYQPTEKLHLKEWKGYKLKVLGQQSYSREDLQPPALVNTNKKNVAKTKNTHAITPQVFTDTIFIQELFCTLLLMSNTSQETHKNWPTVKELLSHYSVVLVTNFHAKNCTWRKCNFVIMCNIMHFSTVFTSRLKHFSMEGDYV